MRSMLLTVYYKSAEYREMLRLCHWLKRTSGVVVGLPGTKKTTYVLQCCERIKQIIVFSEPLRKLRDQVYQRIMQLGIKRNVIVFKAHDEVCSDLRKRLEIDDKKPYFVHLAEHVKAVKEGRELCAWRAHVRKVLDVLKSQRPAIILTTHSLALVIWLIEWITRNYNVRFIFDEGDDIFLNVSEPLYYSDLKIIETIEPKIVKKILRLREKATPTPLRDQTALFMPQRYLWSMFTHATFITATWPPSIDVFFFRYFKKEIPKYRLKPKNMSGDIIFILEEELGWRKSIPPPWWYKLEPQIMRIIESTIKKFGTIAIVSRNHDMSKLLVKKLDNKYKVWSDHRENNPVDYKDADVVIIVPLGKGYRGINFFSNKTGGDFPVVLAFYQVKGPEILHPVFYTMFFDPEGKELENFVSELVMAKNLQALFRFNRDRFKKHILILLDHRYWKAFKTYVCKHYERSQVKWMSINNVAKETIPVIENFVFN